MSDIKIGSEWVNRCDGVDAIVKSVGNDCVGFTQIINGKEYFYNHAVEEFKEYYEPKEQGRKDDSQNIAASILQDAIDAMSERGKSYDTDGKGVERSMDKVVAMFNTLTGHTLTTEQGWDFMILLKLVRASQGYKHDNYIDGSAYFGLAGEAASEANDD